jgi:AraC-like DNA-binding protein
MNKDSNNLILLNIGLAHHNADWNYEKIRSPFARIYYITKGEAIVKLDTSSHILKPFHMYLIPPFTTHTDECTGEFELYYLHLYEAGNVPIGIFEQFNFPFEIKASNLDLTLIKRLISINPYRELKKYDPKIYDNTSTLLNTIAISSKVPIADSMESQGILQQLLSRFLRDATLKYLAIDKRILKAIEFINTNIDKDIDIKKLADTSCVSTDHFIRLFKKEVTLTPQVYINEKKIEKAQSLLIFTNQSVKSIALQLSFGNISYFNRLFKKQIGFTPLEYRSSV